MYRSAGARVSAAVKNSPIKKISFLRGNEGWRAINVRRENDLWQARGGRGCMARGRRGRAYHKLMNYQTGRARARKRDRERDASMWHLKYSSGAHWCTQTSPSAIFIPPKSFILPLVVFSEGETLADKRYGGVCKPYDTFEYNPLKIFVTLRTFNTNNIGDTVTRKTRRWEWFDLINYSCFFCLLFGEKSRSFGRNDMEISCISSVTMSGSRYNNR